MLSPNIISQSLFAVRVDGEKGEENTLFIIHWNVLIKVETAKIDTQIESFLYEVDIDFV